MRFGKWYGRFGEPRLCGYRLTAATQIHSDQKQVPRVQSELYLLFGVICVVLRELWLSLTCCNVMWPIADVFRAWHLHWSRYWRTSTLRRLVRLWDRKCWSIVSWAGVRSDGMEVWLRALTPTMHSLALVLSQY